MKNFTEVYFYCFSVKLYKRTGSCVDPCEYHVDLCIELYILILVWVTLTFIQD